MRKIGVLLLVLLVLVSSGAIAEDSVVGGWSRGPLRAGPKTMTLVPFSSAFTDDGKVPDQVLIRLPGSQVDIEYEVVGKTNGYVIISADFSVYTAIFDRAVVEVGTKEAEAVKVFYWGE